MNPFVSTTSSHQVAATLVPGGGINLLPELTLTLSATQADTLEDALLTFAPRVGATIHPTMPKGDRARFDAHIAVGSLPAVRVALQSYGKHIAPQSRAVASLLRLLQGGSPA